MSPSMLHELSFRSPTKTSFPETLELHWRWWLNLELIHTLPSHGVGVECVHPAMKEPVYHHQCDQQHRVRVLLWQHHCCCAKRQWEHLGLVCSLHRMRYSILGAQGSFPSKFTCHGAHWRLSKPLAPLYWGYKLGFHRNSSSSLSCLTLWGESQHMHLILLQSRKCLQESKRLLWIKPSCPWACSYSPKKPRNPADEGVGGTLRATQPRKQSDLVEEDLSPETSLCHEGLSKWKRSVTKKTCQVSSHHL